MRNRFKTFLSVLMVCLMVLGTPLSAMAADFSDGYAIAESTQPEFETTQEEVTDNEDESSETLFNDAEETDFTDNEAVPEFSDEMAAPAADICCKQGYESLCQRLKNNLHSCKRGICQKTAGGSNQKMVRTISKCYESME